MKKSFSVMLAAVLLLAVLPLSVSGTSAYYIGDVNRDQSIDMFDYLLIKSIYFEAYTPDEAQKELADINGDNSIDMFDYLLIKRAYFSGEIIDPPEKSDWNSTEREIEFTGYAVGAEIPDMGFASIDSSTQPSAMIITSKDQLDTLVSLDVNAGWDADGIAYCELGDFANSLPENYFDKKALLAVQVALTNGGVYYDIEKITADENGINMQITYTQSIYSAPDIYIVQILFAEVDKNEVLGCPDTEITVEELYWPFGKFGSYDATPRDIPYTAYSFNRVDNSRYYYLIDNGTKGLERPFFFRYSFSLIDFADYSYDYGRETASFADYALQYNAEPDGYNHEYFETGTIMYVYAASDDSRSVFNISSIRADEEGITVTVNHTLAESESELPVFTMFMVELAQADISGCQRFKVVFEGEPFTFPTEKPLRTASVDPNEGVCTDHRTPEGYGTTVDETTDYIGTGLSPVYINIIKDYPYSWGHTEELDLAGIKLLLLDENKNTLDYSYTNSDGIARFVVELDKPYYIAFEGNEQYYSMGLGVDNGERFGFVEDDPVSVRILTVPLGHPTLLNYDFALWERSEDLVRYEFRFYDSVTNQPIEGAYYEASYKNKLTSDADGVLVIHGFFSKISGRHITLYCDGYADKVVILSNPDVQSVYNVYLTPEK